MPKILLADDEEHLRDIFQEVLEFFGHSVVSCASGVEAQEIFSAAPFDFDLVILDYTMPGINGMYVLRLLRAIRVDIPVILTSGEKTREDARNMGFSGFIPKPAEFNEIEAAIRAAL